MYRLNQQSVSEIRDVQWFSISDLPKSVKDKDTKEKTGYSASSFFLVLPFLSKLKHWICEKKKKDCEISRMGEQFPSRRDTETIMLPKSFLPESWDNFSFDQEEISLSLMGLPSGFVAKFRYI